MKNIFLFVAFFLSLVANAQSFKRYQVKSGHIRYQTFRFILHTEMHTAPDGKIVGKSEQIPYVKEIRDYYWDNYGDRARDVIYQASGRDGKPLPEKKKIMERLWRDGRMYYLENGKVAFDPDYLRNECMEKEPLFREKGWFMVLYPDAKPVGKEKIAGKEGTRYDVDAFSEYVLWKGLILQNMSFYTNRAGQRKGKEQQEIALKVETLIVFKPDFFRPLWYENFKKQTVE